MPAPVTGAHRLRDDIGQLRRSSRQVLWMSAVLLVVTSINFAMVFRLLGR